MRIDYLGHSGFLAETDSALLLFDYYRGDLRTLLKRIPPEKPLYVFISHAHRDHFNPAVFSLAKGGRDVHYLLSFDIKGSILVPRKCRAKYLEADETYGIEGLGTVSTLLSTDEGVAFLVRMPEKTMFHAGDLNWWDWPGEDPAWLTEQEAVFKREIQRLKGTRIDAAFIVLDDRLEENYSKGMELFLSVCHPAYVLPMHFWKDRSVVKRFGAMPGEWKKETVLLDTAEETHWEL